MTRQGMAENGGFCRTMRRKMADFVVAMWRIMADFAVVCGGLWRILSDYVADYGGFCRTMWRILSQYGAVNVAYIDHSQTLVLLPGAPKQDIISNETLEILLMG